jgi:MerR family transcriptional regulator, copper efflux regulator
MSDGADVLGLFALAAGSDVELDDLTLAERLVARALNLGVVDEYVVTLLTRDKAETLVDIEELNCTGGHWALTFKTGFTNCDESEVRILTDDPNKCAWSSQNWQKDFVGRENPLTFKSTRRFRMIGMTTVAGPALQIREVSARTGFSTTTLRYYEEIGLIRPITRTAAGYRLYDDRTIDRLAFITRAKQLGCSLGEIADLTRAWDGGECGPMQNRLRNLVAEKLSTAYRHINELVTLAGELQRVAASLELHRPDGPCDDRCGCITDVVIPHSAPDQTVEPVAQPVALAIKLVASMPPDDPPIACTLDTSALPRRVNDWHTIVAHATCRESIEGGLRVTFADSVSIGELAELVAAERGCCSFIRFSITVDHRGVALEAGAPASALPVLVSLLGDPQ